MQRSLLLMAAVSLSFAAAPAAAQGQADVRCLMLSNFFAKSGQGEQVKKVAEAAKYYYLGRVHGQFSDKQLAAALVAQQKALKGAHAGQAMQACARQMLSSAARVETLGRRLQQGK
jgi:hypothetical protein